MTEQGMDPKKDPIRIIIVDDHPIVREGVRALLSREPDFEVCGDVGTGAEALDSIRLNKPHIAIVDMLLDNEHGLDLIHSIKQCCRTVKVLAFSMYDDRLFAERALAAGARGYINKRMASGRIVQVVRKIMDGEVFLNEETKQTIINRSVSNGAIQPKASIESLSNRELEIFRMVGQGMSPSEIAERIKLSRKTVEANCQKLRRYLQLGTAQQLAREATQWFLENG